MKSAESSYESEVVAESAEEAAEILFETMIEFADVVLNLVKEDEKNYSSKYRKMVVKPSTKIVVITGLLKLFNSKKERLCIHYTDYVLNWKDQIVKRNDKFFLENDHIFPGAPKEDIEFFRDIWRPNSTFALTPNEKEVVFEYFDTMIDFCEQWKEFTGYTAKWENEDYDPHAEELGPEQSYLTQQYHETEKALSK